jgi:hypothetical protein
LAAGGQSLQIWDLTGGMPSDDEDTQVWMSPDPLDEEILSLTFSPSGQALATLSAEGMVTFWAVAP